MNRKSLLAALTLMLTSLHLLGQNSTFTLSGKLTQVSSGTKIYLVYYNPNAQKDSTTVQNGAFEFKGDISSPVTAQLQLLHGEKKTNLLLPLQGKLDFLNFYLDKGEIKVNGTDSVKNLVITNSKINDEDKRLSQKLILLRKKEDAVRNEYHGAPAAQRKDSAFYKSSNEKLLKVRKEIEVIKLQFVKENPDSYVSLNAISGLARGKTTDYHKLDSAYRALSNRYKKTILGVETQKMISMALNIAVGSMALDFSQPDANGKFYKLSDFRGKYVLFEFWASWCGPCRKENPNLVKAYAKYKDKNFTIVGLSLDTKREAWLEAVAKDKITYVQLDDFKGPGINEVAIAYSNQGIPENYLIDPTGKIIAKNIRGEALNKKLSELFN